MFTIYVYVLDTLADWEPGHVISELNSGRFFKKDAQRISLKTVGLTKEPVRTMGGLTILPDCVIDDIAVSETSVLLLPGADTWNDSRHGAVLEKAGEFLSSGATVCAICGATAALAGFGLLDNRAHTSKCAENAGVDFALAVWGSHTKTTPANYYLKNPMDLLSVL